VCCTEEILATLFNIYKLRLPLYFQIEFFHSQQRQAAAAAAATAAAATAAVAEAAVAAAKMSRCEECNINFSKYQVNV
jgi:hypothetical protein